MTKRNGLSVTAFVVLTWIVVPLFSAALSSPASAAGASSVPLKGICVYYSDKYQGHLLASGEKYDKEALTAAHRTLPLGTMVKVTNLRNNKSVVVRVNDRGPYAGSKTRIIELTSRAAKEIDIIKEGKAQVQIEILESGKN